MIYGVELIEILMLLITCANLDSEALFLPLILFCQLS